MICRSEIERTVPVTSLGYIIERCRGFRSRALHKSHENHPVVCIGPRSLIFSSPGAIRDIYGHGTACVKGEIHSVSSGSHSNILDVVNKAEHARKHRYMSHAFATRNLETWKNKSDKVQRLVRQFDSVVDTAGQLDFRKWTNLFTVEAIVDIAVATQRLLVWTSSWFPLWRAVLKIVPRYFRTNWRLGNDLNKLARYVARERIRRHNEREDLDNLMRCVLEDNKGMPRNLVTGKIEAELTILMDAGSDTTAIALTNVMYRLLKNNSTLERLREEIDAALSNTDSSIATYSQVGILPYLRACLDESLQLSSPVAFGLNRKTPLGGTTTDGHLVPGGITVGVLAYTAHRNLAFFPEPEAFHPECWIGEDAKKAQASFITFSTARRGCIRRHLSYME
ncbi:cytochrome P450 [Aspergillus californicus]